MKTYQNFMNTYHFSECNFRNLFSFEQIIIRYAFKNLNNISFATIHTQ
jgi:hypothetical protein